jgi:hypothetical protein
VQVGSCLLFLFILIVFDVGRMTDPSLAREVGLITRRGVRRVQVGSASAHVSIIFVLFCLLLKVVLVLI